MEFPEEEGSRKRYLLLFFLAAACLAVLAWSLWEPEEPEPALVVEEKTEKDGPAAGEIEVYISGGVKKPGVYDVPAGSRVYELVRAAGDIIPYANVDAVNLSAKLSDGDMIHIPIDPNRTTPVTEPVVNINTAGRAELETLPGIGEVTAQKIIDYRREHGLFQEKKELMNVPSIGEGRYAKIEDKVTL